MGYQDVYTIGTFVELTIAAGVITLSDYGMCYDIDTEADAASDDLDTITGGVDSQIIIIKAEHTDRTVIVKHGTSNIFLGSSSDVSLDNTSKALMLVSDGTNWYDLGGGMLLYDHAVATTGVHGVGGSTVASVANIATHAGLTATHGAAGIADVSDIAVDANLSAAAQDAITKKHAQAHLITSTSDHTPTGLTASQLLCLNAGATAIESSGKIITDFEASGAVSTHAALTETHGATGAITGTTNTQTFTNKRITTRITTISSHATPTINTDNCDAVTITAQAEAITSMTTNLSGTPTNFQKLIIRVKDNGTARAISWGASFVAKGVALPTTTVATKLLTVGFIYDTVATTWGCVASVQEV